MVFEGSELKSLIFALPPSIFLIHHFRVDQSMRVQGTCTRIVNSTMGVDKVGEGKRYFFELGTTVSYHKKSF